MNRGAHLVSRIRCARTGARPLWLIVLGVALVSGLSGCVTRTAYDALRAEHAALDRQREALETKVERLEIERNSLQEQFYEAQESYEDERVVRTRLASNLTELEAQAKKLDADLGQKKRALMETASALAAREAEIAALQSTYDEMVMDLEAEVSSGQIEIERLRDGIRLNVSDDVLFASGSAELDRIGREVLVKVAGQLKSLDDFIEVRGHTDDRPIRGSLSRRFPTNWELAAARAARVVRLLEERGVPGDRLAAVSLGPNDPVAPNSSAENRARNRRIEIRLEPRGKPQPLRDRKRSKAGSERQQAPGETIPKAKRVRSMNAAPSPSQTPR